MCVSAGDRLFSDQFKAASSQRCSDDSKVGPIQRLSQQMITKV